MISDFLNQTVTLTPKAATKYDEWGQPSAGLSQNCIARAECVQRRIQSDAETFVDIKLEVWLLPNVVVENNDAISFDGVAYKVAQVDKKYDMDGKANHIKVLCK